jgi:hypothetical protein
MQRPPDGPFDPEPYAPRASLKEELLVTLFHAYNELATTRRVGAYLETLHDVGLDELEAASRQWRRQRHTKAPSPGELLALVEATRRVPSQPAPATETAQRAAPGEVVEALDQWLAQHPDGPLAGTIAAVLERLRRRAQTGKEP